MNGWIKLQREIQEHWIWQNEKYLKWWLTILMNVNYESRSFPVGNQIHVCNPGQSFRSIESWTNMFSCSKKTTVKFFEMLKNDGMILIEVLGTGNQRKHLLTVVNWSKDQQQETERVLECSENENPNVTPNKKDKNEKINISIIFENFRKQYPGLKRGLKPELDNFLKKNNPETVDLLLPALHREIAHRNNLLKTGQFVPEWKNLTTWIDKKSWTQEFPEISNNIHLPKQSIPKIPIL